MGQQAFIRLEQADHSTDQTQLPASAPAHATLANPDVNFCLVPEVPFTLEGEGGFLQALERRLASRRHAVIVVAEGAGQEILQDPANQERDASGNLRLQDVGVFLRDRITRHFAARRIESTIKYIDPSYLIRSLPTNAIDSEFCLVLGQQAVHAGMAGQTDMVVGFWNQRFTHMPIALAVRQRKQLEPQGLEWQSVLQATGQPASLVGTVKLISKVPSCFSLNPRVSLSQTVSERVV